MLVSVVPSPDAEITAEEYESTFFVVIENCALVFPDEITTLFGMLTRDGLAFERVTTTPPALAGRLKITTPVVESPFSTMAGPRIRLDIA